MNKNILISLLVLNMVPLFSMETSLTGQKITRTYAIDPRYPATDFQPGESSNDRNNRLAQLIKERNDIVTQMTLVQYNVPSTVYPIVQSAESKK